MADYMVTTMDNPWNPFTHYHQWLDHDVKYGYNTDQWIYILSKTSSDLVKDEMEEQIDVGVNRLLELDPFGIHVKIYDYEADTLIPIFNKAYNESMKGELPNVE